MATEDGDGDGFTLNFATSKVPAGGPSSTDTNKRKGRWTDRLKHRNLAKRIKRGHFPGQSTSDEIGESTADIVESLLPTGRANPERLAGNAPKAPASSALASSGKTNAARPKSDSQIVSSLFESHGVRPIAEKVEAKESVLAPPTNAPLDTSTFESAGIAQHIIDHIKLVFGAEKPTAIQQAALKPLLRFSPSTNVSTPESEDEETELRDRPRKRFVKQSSRFDSDQRPDILIQSETGSGKTLAYLLPILLHCMEAASRPGVELDRSSGTLAIILVPTRELALQLLDIAEALFRTRNIGGNRHHIVPGSLTGGTTKTHEKARLRKGINILIATPGRLLDHLQNTEAFASSTSNLAWLVFDEADRLMGLGFEETLTTILKILDSRRRVQVEAYLAGGPGSSIWGGGCHPRRQTILCSATVDERTKMLAGFALREPVIINAKTIDQASMDLSVINDVASGTVEHYSPPAQLVQSYVVLPTKLRLVTLIAALKSRLKIAKKESADHSLRDKSCQKAMVFFSCTDSVDFHWRLLSQKGESSQDLDDDKELGSKQVLQQISLPFAYIEETPIFRLHGSLTPSIRLATFKAFAKAPRGILFCTDVAARGLNLSDFSASTNSFVDLVIQYDPPTDAWREYIHRVGRTARMGKKGEAILFLLPSERELIGWLGSRLGVGGEKLLQGQISMESLLRKGFSAAPSEDAKLKTQRALKSTKSYETEATDVQLTLERWIIANPTNLTLATQAFLSHVRAYATHSADTKEFFHVKNLHLGHLAKSFGLREAPKDVALARNGSVRTSKQNVSNRDVTTTKGHAPQGRPNGELKHRKDVQKILKEPRSAQNLVSEAVRTTELHRPVKTKRPEPNNKSLIESRMQDMVRQAGRRTKQAGVLASHGGADEFQVGNSGYAV